ncbi:hypothetical protein AYM40_21500 [Paraburkholderia phytofirmans OLGA172]|uniref:Uncharacterized protein n=1 Tax=Paraburkholderia phytofirmans OLGA172 TaxID=1417228 RepID=A0A160FR81_9BURK|nr:hypothetical protein [Paraburkholderia phytofirmans]ANB75008.1 hypothetical protein AYM40_21500 [Paraburkholderia phytofirmans OLGA172]
MKDALLALIRSFWGMLLILGFLLLVGGAASSLNVKGTIFTPENRLAMYIGAAVCLIVSVSVYIWEKPNGDRGVAKPVAADYDIKILDPKPGVSVQAVVRVLGTVKKPLPPGYRLQLVRRWETRPDTYYPVQVADIDPDGEHWTADKCYVGGDAGDGRILEAVLVGPDAALLFDTWKTGFEAFLNARKNHDFLFPGIQKFPPDAVVCARVRVVRV